MIIQRVIKGIGGISRNDAEDILRSGILCNWLRNMGPLPNSEVSKKLTERNLLWHQNRYNEPDPLESYQPFCEHTPFISTTAGTVVRDLVQNLISPARDIALEFATEWWSRDAYLFYCYLFVMGRPTVHHQHFSEELRELNIYTGFSPYQPEGEITAKIIIPPIQIEKFEFYRNNSIQAAFKAGQMLVPDDDMLNHGIYRPPEELANIRDILI